MGVDIRALFTVVFGIGAALCAVAGALLGPLLAVQVGMGENILILAFVVIVIGGIGSIRGALVGAMLVGCVDTLGRTLLQHAVPRVPAAADGRAPPARRSRRSRSTCSWRRCSRSGRRACSRRAADGGDTLGIAAARCAAPAARCAIAGARCCRGAARARRRRSTSASPAAILVYAIAATSLNLVLGYGGMVSFGHAAFVGARRLRDRRC